MGWAVDGIWVLSSDWGDFSHVAFVVTELLLKAYLCFVVILCRRCRRTPKVVRDCVLCMDVQAAEIK